MNGARLAWPATYPTALVLAAGIAALYVGRDVFIPVALAILLSFMLAPITVWLQRRHVPRIASVICAVSIAFIFIAAFAYTVASQVTQLAGNLPLEEATEGKRRQSQAGREEAEVLHEVAGFEQEEADLAAVHMLVKGRDAVHKGGQLAEQFHPDQPAADDHESEELRFPLRVGLHVGALETLDDVVAEQQGVGESLEREGVR